jgi:hypothetical protein
MEADFSGYATKAGLKCTDGRTIMPDAFKHQDTMKVPLVWQHGHNDPENVLGHTILENRENGVYAYGYFNKSGKAEHARGLVEHGDINMMSIWANDLIERAGRVLHGAIREVSLVLSGANPGALIENVTIRHSNDDESVLEDEAIIYTGLILEHAAKDEDEDNDEDDEDNDEETVQDVYESMSEKQKNVLHYMLGEALEVAKSSDSVKQDNLGEDATAQDVYESMSEMQQEMLHGMLGEALDHASIEEDDDATIQDVYDSMSEKQKQVLHYMVGEAVESSGSVKQDNLDENNDNDTKGNFMKHNIFENDDNSGKGSSVAISHSDLKEIVATATKNGSLKDAVEGYALAHGIENIDLMFPDAQSITDVPEWIKRRTVWVDQLLQATRKSPFSRVKTLAADITMESARAKGYVTGTLKKEEFFTVSKRVTTPTTVYKKQKLDRDDMIDITDFDVVAWLKAEMRLMLDEEIARAILIGDGRDVSSEDKINEQNIRPIAKDHELYTTTLNVNVDDSNSSPNEVIDAVILNRHRYKGTGTPSFFTTESWISRFLLLKDSTGRRIYKTLAELAADLRVIEIIPVEVMEEEPDLIGIMVNLADYVIGADKGGAVSMFDDFDIDYNQYKYLIETRACGALVKLKSAMVIRKTAGTNSLASPDSPAFNGTAITITNQPGVVYTNRDTGATMTAAGSPYAVPAGTTTTVDATPANGYYFATSDDDTWSFTNNA